MGNLKIWCSKVLKNKTEIILEGCLQIEHNRKEIVSKSFEKQKLTRHYWPNTTWFHAQNSSQRKKVVLPHKWSRKSLVPKKIFHTTCFETQVKDCPWLDGSKLLLMDKSMTKWSTKRFSWFTMLLQTNRIIILLLYKLNTMGSTQ